MDEDQAAGCCDTAGSCVFSKALLARAATCGLSRRASVGEHELLSCGSPVARINCGMLAALLHERARFALRLPPPGRPLMHVQSLRLQCGGLTALRQALPPGDGDVHRMVCDAQDRHGSLAELPWEAMVPAVAAWQARKRAVKRE